MKFPTSMQLSVIPLFSNRGRLLVSVPSFIQQSGQTVGFCACRIEPPAMMQQTRESSDRDEGNILLSQLCRYWCLRCLQELEALG